MSDKVNTCIIALVVRTTGEITDCSLHGSFDSAFTLTCSVCEYKLFITRSLSTKCEFSLKSDVPVEYSSASKPCPRFF